jgi:hypothetical protein
MKRKERRGEKKKKRRKKRRKENRKRDLEIVERKGERIIKEKGAGSTLLCNLLLLAAHNIFTLHSFS